MAEPALRGGRALKLIYFPLWAKGPAPALALAHSGLAGPARTRALEGARRRRRGRAARARDPRRGAPRARDPQLPRHARGGARGATEAEFLSQQLGARPRTCTRSSSRCSRRCTRARPPEGFLAFWRAADARVHTRDFGLNLYHDHLARSAAPTPGDARFTAAGCSVGECKLFASLHALVLIRADVLAPYPLLAAFYARFEAEPPTREILATAARCRRRHHRAARARAVHVLVQSPLVMEPR